MMSLRSKFLLFVFILHVITLVLCYFIFDNKLLFIASEILILLSLYLSWQLYKGMIRPLQTLMDGAEAIKSKDFNVKFLHTGSYEMDQLIDVYNGMMDHLREERTRQEEQHFFLDKLVQTSPTGILIADFDGKIRQVNPRGCELLGIKEEEVRGKVMSEIESPVLHEIDRLASGEAKTVTVNSIQTFKIQRSHFIDRGFPRSFVMIEELTAEILAAEKKAYGKVIRMMAHEVNNTIGPVNSILQSTLKTQALWAPGNNQALADALQVAFDRNQNLNLFMRNFADVVRLPLPVRKTTDLHKLVNNVVTLMELKAGEKHIRFECKLAEEKVLITADEQQMEQAFINIVKNAIEAIEEKGIITISTTTHPKTITIRDTGKGISKDDAGLLFSPFFSTKRDGQGIGLTLVKEILLNHGYEFSLQAIQPGETVFTILLDNLK
jgi:nitrogen fixation/metabolism regulation signal transduction histidine kinase